MTKKEVKDTIFMNLKCNLSNAKEFNHRWINTPDDDEKCETRYLLYREFTERAFEDLNLLCSLNLISNNDCDNLQHYIASLDYDNIKNYFK